MSFSIAFTYLLLVIFLIKSEDWKNFYVDPDGKDEGNDCTSKPCRTFSHVFEILQNTKCNIALYVSGNNFITTPLILGYNQYQVSIQKNGKERAIMKFSETSFIEIDSSDVIVIGIKFETHSIHYQEIIRFPNRGIIRDCVFEDILFTETMLNVRVFDNSIVRNCSDAYGGGDDSRIFNERIELISGSVFENNQVQIMNARDQNPREIVIHNTKFKFDGKEGKQSVDFNIFRIDNSTLRFQEETTISGYNLYYGATAILLMKSKLSLSSSYIMDNTVYVQSGGFDHFVVECFNSEVYLDDNSYIRDNHLKYIGSDQIKMANVDCDHRYDLYACKLTGPGKSNAECPMKAWVIVVVIIVVLFSCAVIYLCIIMICAGCKCCWKNIRKQQLGTKIFTFKNGWIKDKKNNDDENHMNIQNDDDEEGGNSVISSSSPPVMYGGESDDSDDDDNEGVEIIRNDENRPLLLEKDDDDHQNKVVDFGAIQDKEEEEEQNTPMINIEKEEEDEDDGFTFLTGLSSINPDNNENVN